MITQQKAIIGYLRKYRRRGITSMEAFEKLQITKLTTRISELRQMGYKFIVIKERSDNAIYNRYFLEHEPVKQPKHLPNIFSIFIGN